MKRGNSVFRIRCAPVALILCSLMGHAMAPAYARALPAPVLAIDFDGLGQGALPPGVTIHTQFQAPDVVPGVTGSAWRTDGFSSYLEAPLSLDSRAGFTLTLCVALESYPSDLEVPAQKLSPSSFAQQSVGDTGFDLYIDTYGRWGFRVATTAGEVRVRAPDRFPLRRWVQLTASVDAAAGVVNLYEDGQLAGSARGSPGMVVKLAAVPLKLASPAIEAKILDFKINRLNGAFDLVAVYPGPLSGEQVALPPGSSPTRRPDVEQSLRVPDSRFAGDALRPRVHPLPPANWTNEPHGFVRREGAWHLFYQRTPNGPFKTLMHWGHMSSHDLVTWQHLPDALWPELQTDDFGFDMKGIWSGDVIIDGGKAFAFYTSVNHGDRLAASNPGIAMAVSEDPQLRDWHKLGPILNSEGIKDFRDPYLWREGESWHMIVGAALETGGGLAYYVLRPGEKGAHWRRQPRFSELGYRFMDPGSVIWEMPVFERLSDQVYLLVVNPVGGSISKYGEPATRAVYWTGEWSGGVFKPYFRNPKYLDMVPGHLAPTVGRAADGQLRAIGIIDERRTPQAQQRAGWAHTFSLPRTWYLMPDQRTLGQAPAPELTALRGARAFARTGMTIGSEPAPVASGLYAYELLVELTDHPGASAPINIDVMGSDDGKEFTRLGFDPVNGTVTVDKSHSTLSGDGEGPQMLKGNFAIDAFGAMRKLRVIVDGSVIEVFVNDAAAYAVRSYPSLRDSTRVRMAVAGDRTSLADVQLWPLRPPGGHGAG